MPPPMNTTNGATAGWRLAAEGGGPLCNERLDGAVGPRFGGGWWPAGGRVGAGGEAWSTGLMERSKICWASVERVDATGRSRHDRRGREPAMNR
jgi:hypothetical protein